MVVMDFSPYPSLSGVTLELSDRSRQMVLSKVTDIVQTLHQNQLVHGDIRSINLLVDDKTLARDEDFAIHLLDFDWADRIGEVKYPMFVNIKTVTRPAGVISGANIIVEHDMEMVRMLF
jgi:tRNA A-37 threonylcarbamoyl transferase component Bud32